MLTLSLSFSYLRSIPGLVLQKVRDFVFPKYENQGLPVMPDGAHIAFGGGRKHYVLHYDDQKYTVRYHYSTTHPITRTGRKSVTTPPLHYHLRHTEIIHIHEGVLGYELNGKVLKGFPGDELYFYPYERHSFWTEPSPAGSSSDELVFDLTTFPGGGLDGDMLDNHDGYLTSMLAAGRAPQFLQMMTFIWDAESVVVIPWMPWNLDTWVTWFWGAVVGPLAGYKASYPELKPHPVAVDSK